MIKGSRQKTALQWLVKTALMLLTFQCLPSTAVAQQADTTRVFTEEHPLVYEDAWDLWPYAFLNENGEPVGYNIDLLRIIFQRLNIPYTIKLKPTSEALNDLKNGQADLMLGMDAHFHDDFAQYGTSVIQLFTHSVVHQKSRPTQIKRLADLSTNKVMVHTGSFSHHLMIQHGWGHNAIPYNDMQEAVQIAHDDPSKQIVWNTLSLKWLIRKYNFWDLELSPVDIKHGEYKFMSNNPQLLHLLDSVYTVLRAEDRLQPIQNKWFYPERQDSGIPSWVWQVAGLLTIVTLGFLTYYSIYRMREKQVTRKVRRSNYRLGLILKTSHVGIWVFNIATRNITKLNEKGELEASAFSTDFIHYTVPEDFERISDAIREVAGQKVKNATLNVRIKERLDGELRNITLVLSVLRRDRSGVPTDIIGTASDITEEQKRQQQAKDNMLRYKVIFNTAMVDMVAYDENGIIIDMNEKASHAFPQGKESIINQHITLQQVLGIDNLDLNALDYTYLTQIYKNTDDQRALNRQLKRDELYYELQLVPVRDDENKLLGIYGTGRNVTDIAKAYSQLQHNSLIMQHANNEINKYIRNIDYVLKYGGVRLATYSPYTHMLTIYSEIDRPQFTLTQARALSFVDDESKRTVQRITKAMDTFSSSSVYTTVKTVLRLKGHRQLYLHISFIPTYDDRGQVNGYFGMCRDVSEIKETEAELALETAKAQEVETVKNAFLHNMSYEIRTPLNTVVGFAELFEMEHSHEDETVFINEIKQSSSSLLKLINDILFLSRLDARMIEFNQAPIDFAAFFEPRCQTVWFHNQQPDVSYSVDSPYDKLVVEVDAQNLGIVIDHIVTLAAQHTQHGHVRARYDYTGDHLLLAFQDSGCGIPPEELEHIFERFNSSGDTGLGMSICQEIVHQMGGKIHIKSEVGKGTDIWVTIPCKVYEIERK